MTGEEHYREAERLIAGIGTGDPDNPYVANTYQRTIDLAQVHATLAVAHAHLPLTVTLDAATATPEPDGCANPACLCHEVRSS